MARFDVYVSPGKGGLLLDCQTDFLSTLTTRLVVPLFRREIVEQPIDRLNPVFQVNGREVVMMTQYMSAVERRMLGPWTATLAGDQDTIKNAVDFLLDGF